MYLHYTDIILLAKIKEKGKKRRGKNNDMNKSVKYKYY